MNLNFKFYVLSILLMVFTQACKEPEEVTYNPDSYCQPQEELCNGVDDDCDGRSDEDFADLNTLCTVGRGACSVEVNVVCSPNQIETTCGAVAEDPGIEICNGIDDDCDGLMDENFLGLSNNCSIGVGACFQSSNWVCKEDGTDKYCPVTPPAPTDELCNGVDDDCDGNIDEGFALLGSVCRGGVGKCSQQTGTFQCTADGANVECCINQNGACLALPAGAVDELCNGVDDDCDGTIDENSSLLGVDAGAACVHDPICEGSRNICQNSGAGFELQCAAPNEQCDGIDNDCDGTIDEDFDEDGDGVASCPEQCIASTGTSLCDFALDCNDGEVTIWGGQNLNGQPALEICQDTEDQDCDGRDPACSPPAGRIFSLNIASDAEPRCPDVNGDGQPDNAFLAFRAVINDAIYNNYIIADGSQLLIAMVYPYTTGIAFENTNLHLLLGTEIVPDPMNPNLRLQKRYQIDLIDSLNDLGEPTYQYNISLDESGHMDLQENGRISIDELGLDMFVTRFEGDIELVTQGGDNRVTPGIRISNGLLAGILSEDQYQHLRTNVQRNNGIALNLDSDVDQIITDDGIQQGYSICLSYQFLPAVSVGWTPNGWSPF